MRLYYLRNVKIPDFSIEMLHSYAIFFAIAILCILIGVAYECLKKRYRYWSDLGIPGPKPNFIIGNMKEFVFLRCTEPDMADTWYKEYRDKPYIGFYNLLAPSVFIMDPELIKKVTEVDFNHFMDHPAFCGHSEDDSILHSLFKMEGERWKKKRTVFSKMFTPRKLKDQFEIFSQRNTWLKEEIDKDAESGKDTELFRTIEGYILKIICHVLYGIDVTKDNKMFLDLENYSRLFMHPNLLTALKFVFYSTSPKIFNFLRMKTFPRYFWNYFSPFTKSILELNKGPESGNGGYLVSLINQFVDSDSGTGMEHREAVGHVFSFLAASHHTTLTTVSYALFLLSQNSEAQEKLRQEVERVKNGSSTITWENMMNMVYLDAVFNETMRLYPLLGLMKRVCTKEYRVDENLTIPVGMDVFIPVQALHMDPEYFEKPEKFLPERFLEVEKPPSIFMPFGRGPRICIGLRMAEISFKIAVASLVSDFIILPSPGTTCPIKKDIRTLFITCMPENGLWVKFRKREVVH